jgi:hypothetical protein
MKIFFIYIICLLLLSCNKSNNKGSEACGCENVQRELPWLKELIKKVETDKTLTQANYWGCIWLGKYKEQDIFVTNMMLGSGGVMYWFFDCHGNHYVKSGVEICSACQFVGNNHVYFDEEDVENFSSLVVKKDIIVYTNPSNAPCN